MRVLIVHNRYRSTQPSGENLAVDADAAMLRSRGVHVDELCPSSDDLDLRRPGDLLASGLGPIYSPRGVAAFDKLVRESRPDIVHVHNVYPLISPWVIRRAKALGVPVVMTIHNFRLDCVKGLYYRDGGICTDCAGRRFALPAIRHRCYRGSLPQSIAMAAGRSAHRGTWLLVDRFVVLTDFHAAFLDRLGVSPRRVSVRPTPAEDPGEPVAPGQDVLFLGRLDESKGVQVLLDAWLRRSGKAGQNLLVAGAGPLLDAVRHQARDEPDIRILGAVDRDAAAQLLRSAGLVAIPSQWYEGFPRVLSEAFAHGRAVVVSGFGGLGTVVDDTVGWRAGGSVRTWADTLDGVTAEERGSRGAAARVRYLEGLTPEASTEALLHIYDTAMGGAR
jgi:glycosyltransferase involved in cell wall biosynthesis